MAEEYQAVSRLLSLSIAQTLLPQILAITTPKGSPLRYVSIPFMTWILILMLYPVERPSHLTCLLASSAWYSILSALDVLILNPKQAEDFTLTTKSNATNKLKKIDFVSNLRAALALYFNTRKINTPKRAKNTPPPPGYYYTHTQQGDDLKTTSSSSSSSISRSRYLIRETAIAAWQYLVLDITSSPVVKTALSKSEEQQQQRNSPLVQWVDHTMIAITAWLIIGRIILGFSYRTIAIVSVSLKLSTPDSFPPLFNRMADAYTLRNFWGKFWHQVLRNQFTIVSNFITRNLLGLARPSLLERYTNVFVVFFLSGVLHVIADVVGRVPVRESGSMVFYLSFTLGYMIEDGVQAVWKRLQGPRKATSSSSSSSSSSGGGGGGGDEPEVWKKVLGYIWVVAFLTVTSVGYFEPVRERLERQMALVPWSVAEVVGLDVLGSVVVVGGVVLMMVFKIEV